MSSPQYLPLDPAAAPDPVTPQATPSDPRGYAMVTPSGTGPAPYNIQAPMDDLTAAVQASMDLTGGSEGAPTGAGLPDRMSPRQSAAQHLMDSPQGFNSGGGTSGWDITPGYSGSSDDPMNGWPNNPQPVILETPIQGQPNSYPANTGTD